ncbi:MAG: DNA gyrase inhibitor YacG [Burkholderiaceae bacterium]
MVAPPIVNCPTCALPVTWGGGSPFRPFCSQRCKLVDLGAWADERYRIAAVEPDDHELQPGATPVERGRDD